MVSEGSACRRPPLPPTPKRRASGDSDFVTYKRRRGDTESDSGSHPYTTAQISMVVARSGNYQQPGHQALLRHWRSWQDTLQGFLQNPSIDQGPGGIQSCICDALRYKGCQPLQQQPTLPVTQGKLANGHGEARESPSGPLHVRQSDGTTLVPVEDGTIASLEANKAMCNNALFDIFVSENFAMLCHSLTATFNINKLDEMMGLANIDARMRNGDYAQNPELFDHDIKQMWEEIAQIGQKMADLASSLSVISRASFQKQAFGHSEIDMTQDKTEETSLVGVAHKAQKESTPTQLTPCDSSHSTIPKQTGTSGLDGVHNCKDCGKKADSEGRIICDGCEGAYHVSCLNLDLEDVPVKWYCPACIESARVAMKNNKNGETHEDCDVCDWLDIVKPKEDSNAVSGTELAAETQESAVASTEEDCEPNLSTITLSNLCKHCGTCEDKDNKFLVCGHPYCSYKFYHIQCLKEGQIAKEKQKKQACWYCPSCLCRGCFNDVDDEYIVLCDGCDDAYHTYCMNPLLTSIPKGKWYCTSCSMLKATDGLRKYEKSILQSFKFIRDAKKVQGVVR